MVVFGSEKTISKLLPFSPIVVVLPFYINLPLLFLISHPSKPFRNQHSSSRERTQTKTRRKFQPLLSVLSLSLSFKKPHTSKTCLVLSLTLKSYLLSSLTNSPMQSSGKFCYALFSLFILCFFSLCSVF